MQKTIFKDAIFSYCRRWRYTLTRIWDFTQPLAMFVGLNPSTADETEDDPTVRRCIGYARAWGAGGLHMTNIFAFRATDPRAMKAQQDPVGRDNDLWIKRCALTVKHHAGGLPPGTIIAAWGNHGAHLQRGEWVTDMLNLNGLEIHCLKITKAGQPAHPLYLPKNLRPIRYEHR